MTEPTTYEIALRGNVGARSLRPLVDHFTIVESEPGTTRLVGVIRDSSQMHGLVAHLASMGVELLSIVPTDSATRGTAKMNTEMNPQTDRSEPTLDEYTQEQRVEAAKRYVEQLQAFYIHAGVFAAGMAVIFMVNLLTNIAADSTGDWRAWWSLWALVGWGIGIAVHGLVVRLNRPSLVSPTWEQRLLEKVLGT